MATRTVHLACPLCEATALAIEDGDPVTVWSPVGEVTAPAGATGGIMPRVVGLPYGYADALTCPEPLDLLSGDAVLDAIQVELASATGV